MKDMPADQRPRERLIREGPRVLSDSELMAILLRTGSADKTAVDLATEVLIRFSGLKNLVQAGTEELSAIKGIGPAKAAQLKAAFELGRRVASTSESDRPVIKGPEDAALMVMEEMRHLDREHFCVLLLNTKHQVLARETISIGTLNSSLVHPRELFRAAIKRSASAVILVHNHPSGDPAPSREDREITQRLKHAGSIIGIEVLDHIIIGDNKFISFKDKGMI
ncbi:MAG: DNA repair protein RadC [Peptococcaceae bacterium]|nr:DNA repair protein RadC [Peptococcaceae bacterium]